MSRMALLLSLACCAWAADGDKPRCTSAINGKLWPESANTDRIAFRDAMRSGDLEICAAYGWKHHWDRLTISVSKPAVEVKREASPTTELSAASAPNSAQ